MDRITVNEKQIITQDETQLKRKVNTIDPITDKRWDDYVNCHPDSTIFHHSAWARVLADSYHCRPAYHVLENERGEILAAAPFLWIKSRLTGKRLICLPHSEYCYPLAYSDEELYTLMTKVREEVDVNSRAHMEIRGWGSLGCTRRLGLTKRSYFLSHVVPLDADPQKVRSGLDRNGRYNLRRAEKSQVTVRIGQGERDLAEFHRLNTETRRKHHLLPQPYCFFRSIFEHLIIPGRAHLLLAVLNGRTIAANIYFCFRDTVVHEFNAQDQDYMDHRPNYLLIWKAMERACSESYRYYDFGRTQPENQPLATFKKHWGSQETALPYYYYPQVSGISSVSKNNLIYRTHTAVNRCLPGFIQNFAGGIIHRHMG